MEFFENRKTKGAISIFLIIITIPTMLLAAVLVDGSRMASARAMTQEAADLAAISVLAAYNVDLKEDFGLFAMEDGEKAKEIFEESFKATLLASGLSPSEEYSERLWEIMKEAVGAGNPYAGRKFLNLYDFRVANCTVTPKFSLAEWQVLENQMVEYAKFRGLFVMADRFDILSQLDEVKKQARENQETAKAMEEKMDVDGKNMEVDRAFETLRGSIRELNQATEEAAGREGAYVKSLEAFMKRIRLEYVETEETETKEERIFADAYERNRGKFADALKELHTCAKKVVSDGEKARKAVEAAIRRLESYQEENKELAERNAGAKSLSQDAEDNIASYRKHYLSQVDELLGDTVLKMLAADSGLSGRMKQVMEDIDGAVRQYGEELEEAWAEAEDETEEEKTDVYYYYFLDGNSRTEDMDTVLDGEDRSLGYGQALLRETAYFQNVTWKEINPTLDAAGDGNTTKIDQNFAKEQSEKQKEPPADNQGAARGEVPEAVYLARPSKTFQSLEKGEGRPGFYNESGDLSAAKKIMEGGQEGGILSRLGEVLRDDALTLSYEFGTFKSRMTGVEKFSGTGVEETDEAGFYKPEWRFSHENGELDMRFLPKKERDTVLRGEIEYMICGNQKDSVNEDLIYTMIFTERMANNVLAMYMEKKVVVPACHGAAAAFSAFTLGLVPEPALFWVILLAWAWAETAVDMDFLIQEGYRIPLFKTNENLVLNEFPEQGALVKNYGESGIFVTYEDYLLLMLLVSGRENRAKRAADLIEMNMKKKQKEFTMGEAYTWLHGKTELSTRYLFGSVAPFQQSYEEGGAKGRMAFTNEIYLGY